MSVDLFRRRRRWIVLLSSAGISGFAAYKAYYLPSVTKKRKSLLKLFKTLVSVAEAVSSSADAVSLVSSDLNRFLRSDSDEIPKSLKQICKIAKSNEFSGSASRVFEALTLGVVRGLGSGSSSETSSSFSDRILDKLFSKAGSGFASVVVGSFARNLIAAFYSTSSSGDSTDRTDGISSPKWIHLIYDEKSRDLIVDCIRIFVSTAVAAYLDRTMEINTYDEFFSGLTNPSHEAKVKDFMVLVCNNAVETLVKTSHQVLTASNEEGELVQKPDKRSSPDEKIKEIGRWVDQVSSTLAVPRNRRLVLDVTGRVTFETVKSFLEFVLWKLYEGARQGAQLVQEEVLERGLEVMRYFSAKSMVIATICFALCMHVMAGGRVLVPS